MKRIRKSLVLLLVLAYTGQALAGLVLPCSNMTQPGAAAVMEGMAHDGHHMPADTDATPATSASDCCAGGVCNMSHCQLAAALPPNQIIGGRLYFARHIPAAGSASPLHPVDSLYRPPISR
jgi:hypothetical protein